MGPHLPSNEGPLSTENHVIQSTGLLAYLAGLLHHADTLAFFSLVLCHSRPRLFPAHVLCPPVMSTNKTNTRTTADVFVAGDAFPLATPIPITAVPEKEGRERGREMLEVVFDMEGVWYGHKSSMMRTGVGQITSCSR